ncbi:hypothetical protein GCM10011409_28550 [Lentibacillus populi]|uniref:Uncharacterized protein n=1 Tax=Lentibacillus populi TaxID=1827502 RepID=A0A9W5TZF7_9BACI|nr:hypothetical protein [Lentibacillus populi]GGB49239.1 hypothetical protein GCM10011409_28550 [Lentibacillus populi]
MGLIFDLLNLAVYVPFLKVNEEDIGRNLTHLKKHQWFQNYLNDEKYRELIIYNKNVRQTIGKFKTKNSYNIRCEKKLHKVLLNVA